MLAGLAISIMPLCIVEKPTWVKPRPKRKAKDKAKKGEMAKPRRKAQTPMEPKRKRRP